MIAQMTQHSIELANRLAQGRPIARGQIGPGVAASFHDLFHGAGKPGNRLTSRRLRAADQGM